MLCGATPARIAYARGLRGKQTPIKLLRESEAVVEHWVTAAAPSVRTVHVTMPAAHYPSLESLQLGEVVAAGESTVTVALSVGTMQAAEGVNAWLLDVAGVWSDEEHALSMIATLAFEQLWTRAARSPRAEDALIDKFPLCFLSCAATPAAVGSSLGSLVDAAAAYDTEFAEAVAHRRRCAAAAACVSMLGKVDGDLIDAARRACAGRPADQLTLRAEERAVVEFWLASTDSPDLHVTMPACHAHGDLGDVVSYVSGSSPRVGIKLQVRSLQAAAAMNTRLLEAAGCSSSADAAPFSLLAPLVYHRLWLDAWADNPKRLQLAARFPLSLVSCSAARARGGGQGGPVHIASLRDAAAAFAAGIGA
jgi:hypothetical protein